MSAQLPHGGGGPSLEGILRAIDERGTCVVVDVETEQGFGQLSISAGILRGAAFSDSSGPAALRRLLRETIVNIEVHEVTEPPPPAGEDGESLVEVGPRIGELLEGQLTAPKSRSGFFATMRSESDVADDAAPRSLALDATIVQSYPPASHGSSSLGSTHMAGSFASPDLKIPGTIRDPAPPENSELLRAISLGPDVADAPIPSRYFSTHALEELGELDQAIRSSRKPNNPVKTEYAPETLAEAGFPRVGRYEVLARIRSGAVGSVYLCRISGTSGFRRLFAMKVLRTDLSTAPNLIDDFFREARALQDLHHPNVIGIVDAGTREEPYLVLDYVEGGSLYELCQASQASRDPARIVTIMLDALAGVSAVHHAKDKNGKPLGLVHHDLTPHNLLVGLDGACRVADFGVAQGGPSIPGSPLYGKPGFVAPERYLGAAGDHRSDVFSLGVVLYTALTGVEPFAAESVQGARQRVLSGQVTPPSTIGLRPPPSLDWVCQKALALSPHERFQSAEEMLIALRKIAGKEDLLASPSQVSEWVELTMGARLAARRETILRPNDTDSVESVAPEPRFEIASPKQTSFSRPPSSYALGEKTVALTATPQLDAPASPTSPTPREKTNRVILAAIVLICLLLVIAIFAPHWLGTRFDSEPDTAPPPDLMREDHTPPEVVLPKIRPNDE